MSQSKKNLIGAIQRKAHALGFCEVGIIRVQDLKTQAFFSARGENLKHWLSRNYQAEMQWMVTHLDKRLDPSSLMEGTQSIICVAMNYFNPDAYDPQDPQPLKIAKYARGTDYHYVVKDRLKELLAWLQTLAPTIEGRALTDSAPILEKPLAMTAGLGWLGKNGNLLTRRHGSFVFLGELLLNIDVDTFELPGPDGAGRPDVSEKSEPAEKMDSTLQNTGLAKLEVSMPTKPTNQSTNGPTNLPTNLPIDWSTDLASGQDALGPFPENGMPSCGNCTRCIDACPTGAILYDKSHYGVVDANKCISYWTIEYKGDSFPQGISKNLNGWIFGCDICQDVCPWNIKFAHPTQEPDFSPRPWNEQPKADVLLNLSPEAFRELHQKSPIKRTKLSGLQRNVREATNYIPTD